MQFKNIYLIHFSTDFVFKGNKSNYKEKDKTDPINNYGKTKLMGEKIITKNLKLYVIFRLSWLIGNYSDNFLKKIFLNLKENKKLTMVNDQTNNPTLTSLFQKLLKFVVKISTTRKISCGIYHLANEPAISKNLQDISIINLKN